MVLYEKRYEKSLIGPKQFIAFRDMSIDMMKKEGYDHLMLSALGTFMRLSYLLFDDDRRRVTMHDVYDKMFNETPEVSLERSDGRDVMEDMKDLSNQSAMRHIYQTAFDYATTILEGNQERQFVKKTKSAAKHYRNMVINDLAQCVVGLSEMRAASMYGVNEDSITRAVEIYADGNGESMQSKQVLLRIYEDCRDLDTRSGLGKLVDGVTTGYRKIAKKLHLPTGESTFETAISFEEKED
jgi:hypothetical protein